MRIQLLILLGAIVCNELLLSYCFPTCLFVFVFWQYPYNISLCESLSDYPGRSLLSSWICIFTSSVKFWKFLAIISSYILLCSFTLFLLEVLWFLYLCSWWYPLRLLGPVSFLHSLLFLLLRLGNFNCPMFKFTDLSACLNVLLNQSSEIVLVFVLFSSRIWLFLIICILLLIFWFCLYIVFLIYFVSWLVFFHHFL